MQDSLPWYRTIPPTQATFEAAREIIGKEYIEVNADDTSRSSIEEAANAVVKRVVKDVIAQYPNSVSYDI
jgi:hypothetical protein